MVGAYTIEAPCHQLLYNKKNENSRDVILYRYYKASLAASIKRGRFRTDVMAVLHVEECPETIMISTDIFLGVRARRTFPGPHTRLSELRRMEALVSVLPVALRMHS